MFVYHVIRFDFAVIHCLIFSSFISKPLNFIPSLYSDLFSLFWAFLHSPLCDASILLKPFFSFCISPSSLLFLYGSDLNFFAVHLSPNLFGHQISSCTKMISVISSVSRVSVLLLRLLSRYSTYYWQCIEELNLQRTFNIIIQLS